MSYSPPTFEVDFDVEGFTPTDNERQTYVDQCDQLAPLLSEFPTKILHANLHFNQHSQEYEVKLALVLPGQTFATGDVSGSWQQSLEKSVFKMIRRIEHYKSSMEGEPERARIAAGTTMEVEPNQRLDGKRVAAAIERGNYLEFRKAMYPLEESLRDRIGRWVQRFPQIQAMIGDKFTIADIVEETLSMAFDSYSDWQPEMFFGQWVETLIDPAMKAIARDPEGELEAISFRQTWSETDPDG